MTEQTRGQKVAADIAALLRARNPLIWIKTTEEARVEGYLAEAAASAKYVPKLWDVAQGVTGLDGKPDKSVDGTDPEVALKAIVREGTKRDGTERNLWIMRDLGPWLQGPIGVTTLRRLRNLVRALPGYPPASAQAIIVLSPSAELPPELAGHATVVEWPLPDRTEIGDTLDAAVRDGGDKVEKLDAATRETAIDAAVGLSGEEAAACFARSLVQSRKIDPIVIAGEKKRIIAREGVLEWFDPLPGGLSAVGGLENLKAWLQTRKSAYSPEARAYGLPLPKGALLVGVSGCGKSLTAKAIATAWAVPLLRLDLGALKSKYLGESEGNLRKALRVIEAIGRCVVWLDEVEKALQGATGGAADGGVAADALGAVLTWMEERKGGAFVIATANDASALPPEFVRKGRFDDVWFVDLPTPDERQGVLKAALRANGRGDVKIDHGRVAAACDNFTGAEIANLVPDALFTGFADGAREITTEDLIAATGNVVPLAETAKEKIESLREWAKQRARPATKKVEQTTKASRGRELDIV